MAQEDAEFRQNVSACVRALNEYLPRIAARHTGLVLTAAMAEHVGGALQILMQAGDCTPEQARALLAEIEAAVFAQETIEPSLQAHPPGAAKGK